MQTSVVPIHRGFGCRRTVTTVTRQGKGAPIATARSGRPWCRGECGPGRSGLLVPVRGEDLLDGVSVGRGDPEGEREGRVVLVVLEGDHSLPGDAEGLAELRLGPAPLGAAGPDVVAHDSPAAVPDGGDDRAEERREGKESRVR